MTVFPSWKITSCAKYSWKFLLFLIYLYYSVSPMCYHHDHSLPFFLEMIFFFFFTSKLVWDITVPDLSQCCHFRMAKVYNLFKENFRCCYLVGLYVMGLHIGFLGQIRQMSSQFNFLAFELKLFCCSSCYCVSNSEFGRSISFWVESNSLSTLFNLA